MLNGLYVAGKSVMVVNGAYRGEVATLEGLDEKNFSCSIRLSQVSQRELEGVDENWNWRVWMRTSTVPSGLVR